MQTSKSSRAAGKGKKTSASSSGNALAQKTSLPERKGKGSALRGKGWGIPSATEINSRRACLKDMGFSDDAVEAALAGGLDYNAALDKLLMDAQKASLTRSDEVQDSDEHSNLYCDAEHGRISQILRASEDDSSASCEVTLNETESRTHKQNEARVSARRNELEGQTRDLKRTGDLDRSDWQILPGLLETASLACRGATTLEGQTRDLKKTCDHNKSDWQILLGSPGTALSVASGVGLSSLRPLGAVSQAVGEASDAVFPIVKSMNQKLEALENPSLHKFARVLHSSTRESCDPSQLLVQRGTLLQVIPSTATDIGWMYAERLCGSSLAGWVPTNSVEVLPSGYQLKQVLTTCHSVSKNDFPAQRGNVILVNEETRSENGRIYVENFDGSQTGWIPASAVEEIPSSFQWKLSTRSQVARHETQMTIEGNTLLLVDPGTLTKEGWVFAWGCDGYPEDAVRKTSSSYGWVPMDCLECMRIDDCKCIEFESERGTA